MIILGTNSIKDTGYNVDNSARFDDNAYMSQTWGSSGNRRTWTLSMWIKYSGLNNCRIFSIGDNVSSNILDFFFTSGDLRVQDTQDPDYFEFRTNQVFRDPSAWSHLVIACDTTQSTENQRFKIYHNGTQITSFSTATYPSENYQTLMNHTAGAATVGARAVNQSGSEFDGYMAEVVVLDGTAAAPTEFGEFDSDSPTIWKPKDVSGLTFGTNGFYLDFKDSSNLGNDANGGSDFSETNFAATDQSTDTCTNNFATLNGLHKIDDWSLAQGNLEFTNNSTGHRMTNSSIAVFQGKWYCEVKMKTEAQSTRVGVIDPDKFIYNTYIHNAGRGYAYKGNDGSTRFNDAVVDSSYGATYTTGDIVGIAMDLDNHKLYFSKNGTFQNSGDPTSGATGTGSAFNLATGVFYSFGASTQDQGTNPVIEFNFGGTQTFTISSGNTDGNGYGNFEYAVPSGYYSLNTKNLAEYG